MHSTPGQRLYPSRFHPHPTPHSNGRKSMNAPWIWDNTVPRAQNVLQKPAGFDSAPILVSQTHFTYRNSLLIIKSQEQKSVTSTSRVLRLSGISKSFWFCGISPKCIAQAGFVKLWLTKSDQLKYFCLGPQCCAVTGAHRGTVHVSRVQSDRPDTVHGVITCKAEPTLPTGLSREHTWVCFCHFQQSSPWLTYSTITFCNLQWRSDKHKATYPPSKTHTGRGARIICNRLRSAYMTFLALVPKWTSLTLGLRHCANTQGTAKNNSTEMA